MAQRPQPSLRFADGGSFITRWAQSVMRPDAAAKRLREADAPSPQAPPPAPVRPPAPPPPPPNPNATPDNPSGIRFQDGGGLSKEAVMAAIARQRAERPQSGGGGSGTQPQVQPQFQPPQPAQGQSVLRDFLRNPGSVLRERERKAELGMQDGGHVPGTGECDKIPAKYEPGEFVVSNDMIVDNPGLRAGLSQMRAETLAARGRTVEEADAKALRYHGGLRGGEHGQETGNEELQVAHAQGRSVRRLDGAADSVFLGHGSDTQSGRHAQVSLRAVDGFDPLDRMARDLTGQKSLPPRSPVGNMADDLARNTRAAPPTPPAGPTNPGMANPQARAAYADMARGAAPTSTPIEPAAPKAPGAASKWFGSADDWRGVVSGGADSPSKTLRMTTPSAPTGFAKGLGALQGAAGAYDAYQGVQEGDMVKAGVGTADAVAGAALFTPAAPLAGAYLGVRGAYEGGKAVGGFVGDQMGEGLRDKIGGTINQIGLNTGLWGTDDDAKMQLDAAAPKPADTLRKRTPCSDANAAPPNSGPQPPAAPPNPGGVTRDGNGYSGTDVRGPITINGQPPGGGGISPQNMRAADNLAATDSLRSQGAAMGGQSGGPSTPSAPQTLFSGNDWASRNRLRNLEVSASSPTAGRGAGRAYQAALAMDIAKEAGADPGSVARTNAQASTSNAAVSAAASRENSNNTLRGTMYNADALSAVNLLKNWCKPNHRNVVFLLVPLPTAFGPP